MLASILVLEDDEDHQFLLVDLLEGKGYSAMGVYSAAEAIAAVERELFDIVLADVRMAGEIDGLGALTVLKKSYPDLHCLVMTGFAGDDGPHRALEIQADDYLYKPFTSAALYSAVNRVRSKKTFLQSVVGQFQDQQTQAAQQGVRQQRYACWNLIWVGIRSKLFTASCAHTLLSVWDRLEILELDYSSSKSLTIKELKSLENRYSTFLHFVQLRLKAGNIPLPDAERLDKSMTQVALRRLIEQVNADAVTLEDLHLAVVSWRMTEEERRSKPVFQEVYERLWPPSSK